jgi:hypothetical protein
MHLSALPDRVGALNAYGSAINLSVSLMMRLGKAAMLMVPTALEGDITSQYWLSRSDECIEEESSGCDLVVSM